jgi:PEGA domain
MAACGLLLAACSMSMPSLDMFKSAPPTEVLRIESEPPGADARTAEGQSCRTPCELTVPSAGEVAISFALQGYNPQTINVRAEATPTASFADASAPPTRMQPNPVYAELTPVAPQRQKKRSPPKKKVAAKKAPPESDSDPEPTASTRPQTSQAPASSSPSSYSWPPPPPAR